MRGIGVFGAEASNDLGKKMLVSCLLVSILYLSSLHCLHKTLKG